MTPIDSPKLPTTWSPELLQEFHKFINSLLPISFNILEREKSTKFFGKQISTSFWARKTRNVSYRGTISGSGFENIRVVLNAVKDMADEYKNYVGYIEIGNSSKDDTIPAPEVRAFIREDAGICEIFNEMLVESKMFNSKMSPVYIYLEQAYCLKDKPPEELLKKKIPIREISTFQKISCIE
ncbi:hypothetical protein SMITH_35 [Smithella sp. ME-1]|uniref:Uncharacterized protein n=1 Tax=hydrocarbon metagenome TaxID=938273 RepID=A0A0W8FKU2_9ZZZZ|nr:hypothetical protein SMITH_35 [Smithella sp. ME-1]